MKRFGSRSRDELFGRQKKRKIVRNSQRLEDIPTESKQIHVSKEELENINKDNQVECILPVNVNVDNAPGNVVEETEGFLWDSANDDQYKSDRNSDVSENSDESENSDVSNEGDGNI